MPPDTAALPRAVARRRPLVVDLLSAATALAGLVTGARLHHFASGTTIALALALGSAPAATRLVLGDGGAARRRWAPVTVILGASVVVLGLIETIHTDALAILRLNTPWHQVAINAADELAPLGVIAIGLVVILAGGAIRAGDAVLARLTTACGALVCLVSAAFLAGLGLRELPYRGGSAQAQPFAAGLVVGLAGVLLVALTILPPVGRRTGPAGSHFEPAGAQRPTTVPATPTRRHGRWIAVAAILLLVVATGTWARAQFGNRLHLAALFPDPALAACVARAAHTDVADNVSQRELDSIFSLNCNADLGRTNAGRPGKIRSLQGLAQLPSLSGLDLSENQISDLSPLTAAPQLTKLKMTHNQVSDLSPLTSLRQLSDLGLTGNTIGDLTPLHGLTGLRALGLADNRITDLTPLTHLTSLTQLDVSDNRVSDVSGLGRLSGLSRLTLSRNQIRDPRPLAALPALTMLDISDNRISQVTSLTGCAAIDELWIGGNPLTDVTALRRMPALKGVDLSGLDPADVTGIGTLQKRGIYVGGLA